MPAPQTREDDHMPVTALQLDVLRALHRPRTALRWHSYIRADPKLRGRGQLVCTPVLSGRLLPAYTVRQLIRRGLVQPIAAARTPFEDALATFRDYEVTPKGRDLVARTPAPEPARA